MATVPEGLNAAEDVIDLMGNVDNLAYADLDMDVAAQLAGGSAPKAGSKRSSKQKSTARKRRRAGASATRIGQYEDDAAEESDDEAARRDSDEEREAGTAAYKRVRAEDDAVRARRATERTAEEMAASYEQRMKETQHYDYHDYGTSDVAEGVARGSAQMAPKNTDPRLWMVQSKPGAEMEILAAILNRAAALAASGKPLAAFSAVATADSVIFIEAYSSDDVKEALTGIADVYAWRPDAIKLLGMDEMVNAMEAVRTKRVPNPGDFVRLTRGVYADDVAEVVAVLDHGAQVVVKIVPRIDLARVAKQLNKEPLPPRRAGMRFPQRLFSIDELAGKVLPEYSKNAVSTPGTKHGMRVETFKGVDYVHGLALRSVPLDQIDVDCMPPSEEELQLFKDAAKLAEEVGDEADTSLWQHLSAATKRSSAPAGGLEVGDAVAVERGEMAGVTGVVKDLNEALGICEVLLSADIAREIGQDTLHVPIVEVGKSFHPGALVRVVGGPETGAVGMVLGIKPASLDAPSTAMVLITGSERRIQVQVSNLQATSSLEAAHATSHKRLEGFAHGDLVELSTADSSKQNGMIIGLGNREFTVLMHDGKVRSVPVMEVVSKLNRRSFAQEAKDSGGASVTVGDVVTVIAGPHAGAQATVKHIMSSKLWLHSSSVMQNGGMFTARATTVNRVSRVGRSSSSDVGMTPYMTPVVGTPFGPDGSMRITQQKSTSFRQNRVTEEFRGSTVEITRGRHRGKLGMVVSVNDAVLKVQLHATQRDVPVPKDHVRVVGNQHGRTAQGGAGAYRGAAAGGYGQGFGGATPAIGGATPGIGGATPGFGGATPGFGGATPYGGATGGYGAGAETPQNTGGATPYQHGGATAPISFSGAATPAYHDTAGDSDDEAGAGAGPAVATAEWEKHAPRGSNGQPFPLSAWVRAGVVVKVSGGVGSSNTGLYGIVMRGERLDSDNPTVVVAVPQPGVKDLASLRAVVANRTVDLRACERSMVLEEVILQKPSAAGDFALDLLHGTTGTVVQIAGVPGPSQAATLDANGIKTTEKVADLVLFVEVV